MYIKRQLPPTGHQFVQPENTHYTHYTHHIHSDNMNRLLKREGNHRTAVGGGGLEWICWIWLSNAFYWLCFTVAVAIAGHYRRQFDKSTMKLSADIVGYRLSIGPRSRVALYRLKIVLFVRTCWIVDKDLERYFRIICRLKKLAVIDNGDSSLNCTNHKSADHYTSPRSVKINVMFQRNVLLHWINQCNLAGAWGSSRLKSGGGGWGVVLCTHIHMYSR
jgi:hypothetical protein